MKLAHLQSLVQQTVVSVLKNCSAFLLARVQAGAVLELAADGSRSDFYSSALPHRSLEARATP